MSFQYKNTLIVLNIVLVLLLITNVMYMSCIKECYDDSNDDESNNVKFKDIVISHPDGRQWKNDVSFARLNRGEPAKFSIYSDVTIIDNNLKRFGILQNSNLHQAVEHFNFEIRITPLRHNDINFSWCIMKAGTDTVYLYNQWNNGWFIGYDESKDVLMIVKNSDPRKVAWRMDPMPPPEYITLL